MRDLCRNAVDDALAGGASYADARAHERRSQTVRTKAREVDSVADSETEGIGVRVLVDGAWGFASSPNLSPAGGRGAAGGPGAVGPGSA